MEKKIIVLAGNFEEFNHYLKENNLNSNEAIYGDHPTKIMGVRASKVVTTGTFYYDKKADKLEELALSRVI